MSVKFMSGIFSQPAPPFLSYTVHYKLQW